jgi:hypothetical protein
MEPPSGQAGWWGGPEDCLKLQVAEVRGRPVLIGEVGQACGVQETEWQILWQKKEGVESGAQPGVGQLGLKAQYRN